MITQAIKNVFDAGYPVPDFQDLHVGIEFPVNETDYPGIWVDWEPMGNLTRAGIDEYFQFNLDPVSLNSRNLYMWRFQGYATYTLAAMHSFQRDRLFDELVRVLAFNQESGQISQYRDFIESNPYLAMNMDFDNIGQRGTAANIGTPWGTSEVIYEVTVAMEIVGEVVSDQLSGELYPLAGISVEADDPQGGKITTTVGAVAGTPGSSWR